MTIKNKSKQAISDVIEKLAKEKSISIPEATKIFNTLSQKKRRKLVEATL